jgi:hypothetical protein
LGAASSWYSSLIAASRSTRFRVAWRDPAVDVGGRIVLAIGGLAGLTWLGAGIGEILGA